MYLYHITEHKLEQNGNLISDKFYSGFGNGLNNRLYCNIAGLGPIPPGLYRIDHAFTSPHTGPVVMRLIPQGHDAMGRSGFEMHGDSKEHPGAASHGCIIAPRSIREAVDAGADRMLQVV